MFIINYFKLLFRQVVLCRDCKYSILCCHELRCNSIKVNANNSEYLSSFVNDDTKLLTCRDARETVCGNIGIYFEQEKLEHEQ